MSGEVLNLHAGCILLGEAGILIRGPSGSGKSSLARSLLAQRQASGGFAALVADDRVLVRRAHDRLIASPHPDLAGSIEHRGLGIVAMPYETDAVLRLVIDLTKDPAARLPEEQGRQTTVLGVRLPRVAGNLDEAHALVEAAISWPR